MSDDVTFDGIPLREPHLLEVLAYWNAKRDGRAMPRRADVDPVELRNVLPYIYLMDVLHDPVQFRMRLIGTNVREFAGRDFTGKMIDGDIYGKQSKEALDNLHALITRKRPLYLFGRAVYQGQRAWQHFQSLQLPLSTDGERVDMILGVNVSVTLSVIENGETQGTQLDGMKVHFLDGP